MEIRSMPKNVMDGAHQVALASLGAAAAVGEGHRGLLDDLVRRGRTVEAAGRRRSAAARQRAEARRAELRQQLQERLENAVAEVLERLKVPRRDQVRVLTRRVEELTERVVDLERELEREGATAYHVVPRDGGWAVMLEGATAPVSVHATKTPATAAARKLARAEAPATLVLHRADGTIQGATTYAAE